MSLQEAQERKCLFFEIWLKNKRDGSGQTASRLKLKGRHCRHSPGPIAGLNYPIITNSMSLVSGSARESGGRRTSGMTLAITEGRRTTIQITKVQSQFHALSLRLQTATQDHAVVLQWQLLSVSSLSNRLGKSLSPHRPSSALELLLTNVPVIFRTETAE